MHVLPRPRDQPRGAPVDLRNTVCSRVVHDDERVESARAEREDAALAASYSESAATTQNPVGFEQWAERQPLCQPADVPWATLVTAGTLAASILT